MSHKYGGLSRVGAVAGLLLLGALPTPGRCEVQSPWVTGMSSQTRLIGGVLPAEGQADTRRLVAGVEIKMPKGWKTYWRSPGDAGGIPPEFEFTRSQNLKSAKVLYPAPRRLTDKSGDVIGYADEVIFPIEIIPADAAKPVALELTANFGVCKNICVPVEANAQLELSTDSGAPEADLAAYLDRVPKPVTEALTSRQPSLQLWRVDTKGSPPSITVEIAGGGASADAFLEAVDGSYVPQGRVAAGEGNVTKLGVDLSEGADLAALAGKPIRITIVGDEGAVEIERLFQ